MVSMSAQFSSWTLSHFIHETGEMCWWCVSERKESVYMCERESVFNAPSAKETKKLCTYYILFQLCLI